MNNIVLIAAQAAETAARGANPDLYSQLRAAMTATSTHWLATQEDDQFLAACEGAARVCAPEDRVKIETSLRFLQSLASVASGVPVDFAALIPEDEEDRIEPAPLKRIWHEVKAT